MNTQEHLRNRCCATPLEIRQKVRQALRIRHEARLADRGSIVVPRVAAVAGFVAAVGIADAVPQATAGRNVMADYRAYADTHKRLVPFVR